MEASVAEAEHRFSKEEFQAFMKKDGLLNDLKEA
jgi:hypothetical protein